MVFILNFKVCICLIVLSCLSKVECFQSRRSIAKIRTIETLKNNRYMSMKFDLIVLRIPLQLKDTNNYEKIIKSKCSDIKSDLIRWSITHVENNINAVVEAVIYYNETSNK